MSLLMLIILTVFALISDKLFILPEESFLLSQEKMVV